MKTLIIGGTRFIGAYTARCLVECGADVTVFHRGRTDSPILPPVRHVTGPAAEYPVTMFPDELARADWDAVIHMVLMGAADAEAARSAFTGRAGRFVMVSSCDVYRAYGRLTGIEPGAPDPVPLREDAPLRTVLYPYRSDDGASLGPWARDYEKILAERGLSAGDGPDWTILRLPKVYGAEDNADLATIYGFSGRPGWRWTHGHVRNVAAAIALAARHPEASRRVFNVGEAATPTMGERLARLPPSRRPVQEPPFDFRQDLACETRRIRSELGYADVVDEAAAMAALADRSRAESATGETDG